jgi:hypothetical protein
MCRVVGDTVGELRSAVDGLLAAPPPTDGDTAKRDLIELSRQRHRLDLALAQRAAAFSASFDMDEESAPSPVAWLRDECHLAAGTAASAIQVGEELQLLPQAVASLDAGRIGFSHLSHLAYTAEAVSNASGTFDETALLQKAERLSVKRFIKECFHARHAADADRVLDEHLDAVDARTLEITSTETGGMFLRGFLDSVGGAVVMTALEALAQPCGADDDRARPRRMADALVEAMSHALDAGTLPSRGSVRPHVQLTVSLETMLGLPGAPAAELEGAGAIPGEVARRLACDSAVARIVLSPDANVLNVGRAQRTASPAQRRALAVRDQGCVWPGCDRTVSWTQAHHVRHWAAHDGPTDTDNMVLLCHRHHHRVHEYGWLLARADDGEITVVPPITAYQHHELTRAPDVPRVG